MYSSVLKKNAKVTSSSWSKSLWSACSYPYLAVVLNFCQTWALYCLVQFYSVMKNKLAPIKPLAKFLAFKSIIFLTWWQGVAVAFLFSFGAFKGSLAQVLETRIQDYFICLEVHSRLPQFLFNMLLSIYLYDYHYSISCIDDQMSSFSFFNATKLDPCYFSLACQPISYITYCFINFDWSYSYCLLLL